MLLAATLFISCLHCPRASAENSANNSTAVADLVRQAKEAIARSDYAEALRLVEPAADQGNAEAQALLGTMYLQGHGAPVDYARALILLRKSADQGNALGEGILGDMYLEGYGVTKDPAQAAVWHRKSAEQGLSAAQGVLAQEYLNGSGVPTDYKQAMFWARKAAEQGNKSGERVIAVLYLNGLGVPKDTAEGLKWTRKAAEDGEVLAQMLLGDLYHGGNKEYGITADMQEALHWWHKAADQGSEKAKQRLAKYGPKLGADGAGATEKPGLLVWELSDVTDKMTDKVTHKAESESDFGDGYSLNASAICLGMGVGIEFDIDVYRGQDPEPYAISNDKTVQMRLRIDGGDVRTIPAKAKYTNEAMVAFVDQAALKSALQSGPAKGRTLMAEFMGQFVLVESARMAAGSPSQLANARSIRVELPLANGRTHVVDFNPQDQVLKSFVGQCMSGSRH